MVFKNSSTDQKDIAFTEGVLKVNDTPIGVTKGGAKFKVEMSYKEITYDNQKAPIKNFHRKTKEVATLEVSSLQTIGNLEDYHAGIDVDITDETKKVYSSASDIKDTDYKKITFVGRTLKGKVLEVELLEAINLENIEWDLLVDADEIVDKLTFTATLPEPDSKEKLWKVSVCNPQAA